MKERAGRNGGTIKVIEKGESGNPNGRPKKLQTVIRNLHLDEEGVKLTDSQIKDVLRGFLSKTKSEIDEIISDPNVPMSLKMGFQLMLAQSKKGNGEIFRWLFEMQIGKAQQVSTHKIETEGNEAFKAFVTSNKTE